MHHRDVHVGNFYLVDKEGGEGRQDGSVAGPNGSAHIPGLAGLLGDDYLAGHAASDGLPPDPDRAVSMAARNGPASCFSLAAPTPLTAANSA